MVLALLVLDSFPLNLLIYALACLGHVALCTLVLNYCYSQPWKRKLLHSIRGLLALLAASGPLLFWPVFGTLADALTGADGKAVLAVYALLSSAAGIAFLIYTLAYHLRPKPAVVRDSATRTIDVAEQLGYKPAGRGRYSRLCHLPGNECFQVDFVERTFVMPRLPEAWDGLSILHLTDLHLCGSPDKAFFQHVMDLCLAEEPDIVAITGDIVDSRQHHRWIVPVLGRLRWKLAAFAVLGNHDQRYDPNMVRRRLRKINIRVLGNGYEELDVRGQSLVVIGNETPWFQPAVDLADCPAGAFRLCLSHTPDTIEWAKRHGVDLMLAGHNHGGQLRLPFVGSIFVPSKYSRKYDCGTFHEPPTLLHVGRGLAGQQPLRYNCRPEVSRIVLRCPTSQESAVEAAAERAATA